MGTLMRPGTELAAIHPAVDIDGLVALYAEDAEDAEDASMVLADGTIVTGLSGHPRAVVGASRDERAHDGP
jgi:hypothetical protein